MTTPNKNVVVRRRGTRTPLNTIDQQFHLFLDNWIRVREATTARDKAKGVIKQWFSNHGDADHNLSVNESGSVLVEFDEPLEIAGQKFTGLENTKTVVRSIDPDLVDEWLEKLPQDQREKVSGLLYRPVTDIVFQPDALFALHQAYEAGSEGAVKLDEATMDSFFQEDVTWALNVKRA